MISVVALQACKKEETATKPVPIASFTFSSDTNMRAPVKVLFVNTSKNGATYLWDFGDGTTSTEDNPKHIYTQGGTYTITLTATGAGGTHTTTKTIIIDNAPTKVTVVKIWLMQIPLNVQWDATNGPDVYIDLSDHKGNLFTTSETKPIVNITAAKLPTWWMPVDPHEITDFSESRFIDVWDDDEPNQDQVIGSVEFAISDYLTGDERYPTTVTKTENNVTVKLELEWN